MKQFYVFLLAVLFVVFANSCHKKMATFQHTNTENLTANSLSFKNIKEAKKLFKATIKTNLKEAKIEKSKSDTLNPPVIAPETPEKVSNLDNIIVKKDTTIPPASINKTLKDSNEAFNKKPQADQNAIIGLILGILSIISLPFLGVFVILFSIPAIIVSKKALKQNTKQKLFAKLGFWFGLGSLAITLLLALLYLFVVILLIGAVNSQNGI